MRIKKSLHGILLLDKPKGFSSNQALQRAKNILGAEKAGHTGSLDPMATGLLPICFGEASKFAQYGLFADKVYQAVMKLGVTTTTADAMGEILEHHHVPEISHDLLHRLQARFKGQQLQTPPMYSALKKNGVPLYKLAREGQTIEREARAIHIYDLNLQKLEDNHIRFEVACSKGTYVRTLAEDIAKQLGTGAHLVELRRTRVGHLDGPLLSLEAISSWSEVEKNDANLLLPVDAFLINMPKITLDNAACHALSQGKIVFNPTTAEVNNESVLVRLYTENNGFLGVGHLDATNHIRVERLVSSDFMNGLLA